MQSISKLRNHRDRRISTISRQLLSKWTTHSIPIALQTKKQTKLTEFYGPDKNENTDSNANHSNSNHEAVVYIASMSRGNKWPEIKDSTGKPIKRINVTSGSTNKINGISAKQASPMYLGPVNQALLDKLGVNNPQQDDEEALLFENYWQYGKIFRDLEHLQNTPATTTTTTGSSDNENDYRFTDSWLAFRKKGYAEKKGHRHPKGTKTNQVMHTYQRGNKTYNKYKYHVASTSYYFGEYMDYLTSRKKVYCPMYEALVRETAFYQALKQEMCKNQQMQVMILDFDGPKGDEKCLRVTREMLREKVNDVTAPFGHGYVFAAMLAGIDSAQYCA